MLPENVPADGSKATESAGEGIHAMAAHAPNARKGGNIAQPRYGGCCANGGRLIAGRDAAHLDDHSRKFVWRWEAAPTWSQMALHMQRLTAMMPQRKQECA
jgi:hypothetical protein